MFGRISSRRSPRHVICPAAARRPVVESLERRSLLAAAVGSVELVNGVLEVSGTNRNDTIVLAANADPTKVDVTLNGATTTHDLGPVTGGVRVNGGNGNDTLTVSAALSVAVTVLGGNGKDVLAGGDGDDSLDGGNGNDSLAGGGGDDSLYGGNGNDSLDGQAAADLLRGDNGADRLSGGDGDDDCDGGRGNDRESGDAGNDTLAGGSNNDSLSGGGGDDVLRGDAGNDSLQGDDGDDDVDGDSGRDDVDGGEGADDIGGGPGKDKVRGGNGRDRFRGDDDSRERGDRGDDDDDDVLVAPAALPEAVQTALAQQFPGATVTKAEVESDDGQVRGYEVSFTAGGESGKAEFNADGQLREAEIPFPLLPQAVRDAFNAAQPGATVTRVQAERSAATGDLLYKVRFVSGSSLVKVTYRADGTVASGDGPDDGDDTLAFGELPAAVQSAINAIAPGATFREIERETDDGQVIYKVKILTANGSEREYELTADGTFVD